MQSRKKRLEILGNVTWKMNEKYHLHACLECYCWRKEGSALRRVGMREPGLWGTGLSLPKETCPHIHKPQRWPEAGANACTHWILEAGMNTRGLFRNTEICLCNGLTLELCREPLLEHSKDKQLDSFKKNRFRSENRSSSEALGLICSSQN